MLLREMMRAVEKLAEALVSAGTGLKTMLHVTLMAVPVSDNSAKVFMLVLDRYATLATMHPNSKVETTRLHVGMLAPQSAGIPAHKPEQNGGFGIIDGHVQRFESFEDQRHVKDRLVQVKFTPNDPCAPHVISEESQDPADPFVTTLGSKTRKEQQGKVVPQVWCNNAALLYAV